MTNSVVRSSAGIGLEDTQPAQLRVSRTWQPCLELTLLRLRVLYQLTQAMSARKVQLQDWMSLEHAGGGKQFQDALIETPRIMELVRMLQSLSMEASGSLFDQDGSTSEVMLQTLKVMTNDLSEAQIMEMGYSEEQAHKQNNLPRALAILPPRSAFSQVVGTWQEALGSGWAEHGESLSVTSARLSSCLLPLVTGSVGSSTPCLRQERLPKGVCGSRWSRRRSSEVF